MAAVAIVMVLVLLIFAVAAVQMFTNVFHTVCMGADPVSGEVLACCQSI
jgi:hypothetical protein